MPKVFFQVFEHDRLLISDERYQDEFKQIHLDLLINHCTGETEKYYSIIKNGVRFKSYVGVIQVGNLVIEILPKADKATQNNEDNLNRWQNILFQMLRFTGHLKTESPSHADLQTRRHSLLDMFFAQFIQECSYLVHRGLIKNYRTEQGQVKALKGRLLFAQHLKNNIIHKERFYTEHIEYDHNHLINRLLHTTLIVLQRLSSNPHLNNQISDLLLRFPAWPSLKVDENTFKRIAHNRKTEPYKKALQLSRFILLNYHPDLKTGREDMLVILFNMNYLWEGYVRAQLIHYLAINPEIGFRVDFQESKDFWKPINNGFPSRMKPDIILSKGEETIIMDTKWKQVDYTNPNEHDLRQIFAYCKFWKAKQGYLVYPTVNDLSRVEGTYQEEYGHLKAGMIRLDVPDLIENGDRLKLGEELIRIIK